MSDGTLRALGVLTAVFQRDQEAAVTLVAIEEPETALHPAAARVLLDSLTENVGQVQIILTSHSADLLDRDSIGPENLLAVENVGGVTRIGVIDEGSREALRSHLVSAGELLRLGQISPDWKLFEKTAGQIELFP
jgi:predicted ATPase